MAQSDNEKLDDLKSMRRAQQHIIRVARTDSSSDSFFKRSEADLVLKIANLEKQLKSLRYRREHADDIIDAGKKRLRQLNRAIGVTENQKAVNELLRLQAKMAELV